MQKSSRKPWSISISPSITRSGIFSDQIVIDAVAMRLSAGVEALGALDPDTRTRLLGDQWPRMRGMRNRIAHGYGFIDDTIVRQTVLVNLPPVVEALRTGAQA
nr:HepT-like ribonuclease domain-containing protein [Actinomyces oris]